MNLELRTRLIGCLFLIFFGHGTLPGNRGLLAQPRDSLQAFATDTPASGLSVSTRLVLPLVFFTPETRWGFGAAGFLGVRFPSEQAEARPSSLQVGGAYTLEDQLLLYSSFQVFWGHRRWQSYGELGYYRYTYFFYGIGNQASNRGEELYDVNFPRLRLHLLRRLAGGLYAGIHLWMDDQRIKGVAAGGLLADEQRGIPGRAGGRVVAPGLLLSYDTRNQVNYPSKGWLISLESRWARPAWGSDFAYWRNVLNAAAYLPLRWNHHLAANLYFEHIEGNPPFFAMATLGGTRRMRGYYEGFYRDKKYATFQLAYRAPLFWRLGVHLFGAAGGVAPSWSSWKRENLRYTYGLGLRFRVNDADMVHLRLDVAFGKSTSGAYLTVGEAF